jgi:hypothetical protein
MPAAGKQMGAQSLALLLPPWSDQPEMGPYGVAERFAALGPQSGSQLLPSFSRHSTMLSTKDWAWC